MGTKIRSLAQLAGVKCPKEAGTMDKKTPCPECEYYAKCTGALRGVLG